MAGLGGSLGYAMGGLDWGILGKHKLLKNDDHLHKDTVMVMNSFRVWY